MDEFEVLERLLRRYSPSGREGAAAREFVALAERLGYRARLDAVGNGVATRGRGRPQLLFLGHIDTVEGNRAVRRSGGRLHGRGAVDAKGPLACALVAGARFLGPGTIRVVAAVREETDSGGARHLLRGPRPDAVIAGEPSGWDGVTVAYKGDVRLRATFRRPRRHWASPFPTAADVAFDWLARLRLALEPLRSDRAFRSVSCKLVGAFADPSSDPEEARLLLDLRLPPGVSTDDVIGRFPSEEGAPSIRLTTRIEPFARARTDPVARALVDAIRKEGGTPTLLSKSGTSDLNVVARAWNVPGAAYGPGDSRLDHTDRESVGRTDLARSVRILERAFATLAQPLEERSTLPRSAGAP